MNKEENMKRTKKTGRSFPHLADVLNDGGKSGDTPEEEEKESDEEDESIQMNPGSQTFCSEKQMGVKESGICYDAGQSLSMHYQHYLTKETSDMLSDGNRIFSLEEQASTPHTSSTSSLLDLSYPFEPSTELPKRRRRAPVTSMAQYDMDCHVPAGMYHQQLSHTSNTPSGLGSLGLPVIMPVFGSNITHPQGKSPSIKVTERLAGHQKLPSTSSDFPVFHMRSQRGRHRIMGQPSKRKKSNRAAKKIQGCSPSVRSSGCDSDSPLSLGNDISLTKETSDMLPAGMYHQQLSHTSNTPSGVGSLGLPVIMPAFGSNFTPPIPSFKRLRERLIECQKYRAAKQIQGCSPAVGSSCWDSDSPLSLGNDISLTKETSDMLSASTPSTPSTFSPSDLSYFYERQDEAWRQWRAVSASMNQYYMAHHVLACSKLGSRVGSSFTPPQGKFPAINSSVQPASTPSTSSLSDLSYPFNLSGLQERAVNMRPERKLLSRNLSPPHDLLSSYPFYNPTSTATQTIIPTVAGPPCPENSPVALQVPPDSTGVILEDACCSLREPPETEPGGNQDTQEEMMPQATARHPITTDTLPAHSHRLLQYYFQPLRRESGESRSLPHSLSMLSLSHIPYTKSETNPRAMRRHSSPDILLQDSFERFTPDIAVHENKETYRFQCTSPGLYQCGVTGLVFNMQGEGGVLYRTVPWDQRLLAQHCKKPAGPLFDIKSLQQSVCQLHLPHCEIRSTGGRGFLSVAHVTDEGIEFIPPHKITETHVMINITGFSGFGNVKDDDSPPDPIRALVLLFYIPPVDADLAAFLNVLLLPGNIVLNDVLQIRKKIHEDERYIEISPQCKLQPKQEYMLCIFPEEDSVLVQPNEAEFDSESYDNYFPTFQVEIQEKIPKNMKLLLTDKNSSQLVWERRVCLSSAAIRRPCQSQRTLPPNERLFYIRSSFIKGISGPVLKSLLDKLFERRVINDSERESADEKQNKEDKARFVVDTVRKKGEAASSEMIAFLCELDPFLCGHLGLI